MPVAPARAASAQVSACSAGLDLCVSLVSLTIDRFWQVLEPVEDRDRQCGVCSVRVVRRAVGRADPTLVVVARGAAAAAPLEVDSPARAAPSRRLGRGGCFRHRQWEAVRGLQAPPSVRDFAAIAHCSECVRVVLAR